MLMDRSGDRPSHLLGIVLAYRHDRLPEIEFAARLHRRGNRAALLNRRTRDPSPAMGSSYKYACEFPYKWAHGLGNRARVAGSLAQTRGPCITAGSPHLIS